MLEKNKAAVIQKLTKMTHCIIYSIILIISSYYSNYFNSNYFCGVRKFLHLVQEIAHEQQLYARNMQCAVGD